MDKINSLITNIKKTLEDNKYYTVSAYDVITALFSDSRNIKHEVFSRKLLEFSDKNRFDYIIIMRPNKQSYDVITFWEIPEIKSIEGGGYNDIEH